jgi:hypothetical protein
MQRSLTELFCDIDDFCKVFVPAWEETQITDGSRKRWRTGSLSTSEIMTLMVHFHQSGFRTFKDYYLHRSIELRSASPGLVSYSRFVQLSGLVLMPLCGYLMSRRGKQTDVSFVDSTTLSVCRNQRIHNYRVFKGLAQRSKTSMGWFYGFKLHLLINDKGELLNFEVTPGNVDDRVPVPALTKGFFGKCFGDKGYISQKLFTKLMQQGLQLITKIRKDMKNYLMPIQDKILLRKRALIETVNDQLKNISQIEHTRHRSITGALCSMSCVPSLLIPGSQKSPLYDSINMSLPFNLNLN